VVFLYVCRKILPKLAHCMEMQIQTAFKKFFYFLRRTIDRQIFWCFSIWLQHLDEEYRYNRLINQLDNGTNSVLKAVCTQCDHIYLKVKQKDKFIFVLIGQVFIYEVESKFFCHILISEGTQLM
jgi:hypothetical protein